LTTDSNKEEQQYLDDTTINFIDSEIQKLKDRNVVSVVDRDAAREIFRIRDERVEAYTRARPRPYLGRVDFLRNDGTLIKAYVGIANIAGYVYSWTAPFPGQLYYSDAAKVDGYDAPQGRVRGKITLQRQHAIENAELLYFTDLYRLAAPEGAEVITDGVQSLMVDELSQGRGHELKEAVATIRPAVPADLRYARTGHDR
jgi:DNA helicase IV